MLGDDFVPTVVRVVAEVGVPRERFEQVLARLDILENDLRDLRRAMDERFDRQNCHFETRFDTMQGRFDERLDKMNDRIIAQTRSMVGTIALFGTLITVLLAISQFIP